MELLGSTFGGIVVRDRFSAYNHLPTQQRQLCWAHLIRDLTAIAERPGASAEFDAQLLGPAATVVWPLAPLQGWNDRLARLPTTLPATPQGL